MKIKDRILKARSKLSIGTYKRPQIFIILLMLLLNIIILIIAAFIALVIDDSYNSFFDALANGSLKWMLTPNAILAIDNPNTLILAVFVLVIGMILFTGTIIALTTNAIKDYFQKKKSGSGKLILDKQIVILNWNNKVPELVADLMFLDEEDLSIVILADVDKDEIEKHINNNVRNLRGNKKVRNLNILVKKGNPLVRSDLNDISIEKAKTILIMNSDMISSSENLSKGDLNVIKMILSLGEIEFKYEPPIVAEIKNIETKEKVIMMTKVVKSLKHHLVIPICFDRRLGHVIAQTIINPMIKEVYLSLFSFEDSEAYFVDNIDFDFCLENYSHVIPVARHKKGLYVLAENDKQLILKGKDNFNVIALKTKTLNFRSEMKVYIIGKNNKLNFIKDSFDEYESIYKGNFEAKYIEEENLISFINEFNQEKTDSTILLLSNELVGRSNLDANVINNLIYLQSNLKGKRNIIVEVLDPSNDHIVKDFNINNTIISNKIISLLLSKIALYKETAPFYENLLTIKSDTTNKDDQNIFIWKADNIIDEAYPVAFQSLKQLIKSIYLSFNKEYIPIGVFKKQKLIMFYGDLNKPEEINIEVDDLLILIKL